MNARKQHVWAEIKRAYLADEGSLRTLAARFNVSLDTLEKRCRREKWRQEIAALGGIVAAEAAKVAAERGQEIGLTAASLVERTVKETSGWLDRIEAMARSGCVDPASLLTLVRAWKDTISVGREAFRLDEPTSGPPIINLMKVRIGPAKPGDTVIDCTQEDETFRMEERELHN